MLQRAARSLATGALLQQAGAACAGASCSCAVSYANTANDYSLVMDAPHKELANHVPTPDSEVGMCAGVPLETFQRKVRVYSPARTAGQQGLGNTSYNSRGRPWRIVFDTQEKWINPLMGWTSTADALENVGRASLLFHTKEEAVAFCRKHGWEPQVEEPEARRTLRQKRFNGYGENFSTKRAGVPDLTTLPSERGAGAAAPEAAARGGSSKAAGGKAAASKQ